MMGTEQLILPAALAVFALSQARKSWDKIPASAAPFLDLFAKSERAAGLPATLLARLAWQESRFNPFAENSGTGAQGLMQLVKKWHPGIDPLKPEQAIPYAANYLKLLYKKFGTWEKALAAYNWGPGNVASAVSNLRENWKNALPVETRNYLAQIGEDVGIV